MSVVAALPGQRLVAQDRRVVWLRAGDADLERDLNREAARGLRLAAISDGLPCPVAALQAPATAGAPAAYRVVADRDLAASLVSLTGEGFVPKAAARVVGTRHHVVFERVAPRPAGTWRLLEFEKLEDLAGVLEGAAAEGFRPAVLVRVPFRSWPGLSARGLLLAERPADGAPRATRVLIGTRRDLDDVQGPLRAATAEGWSLDLLFTSARDGSEQLRRERVVLVLSRAGGNTTGRAVEIERRTTFGIFGDVFAGAAAFWNDYVSASTDQDRRQVWATPTRLSAGEANCARIEFALRLDGLDEHTFDIVGLVARPMQPDGYELLTLTQHRLGPN